MKPDVSQALQALFNLHLTEITLEVTVNSLAFANQEKLQMQSNTRIWSGVITEKFISVIREGQNVLGRGRGGSVDEAIASALASAEACVRGELRSRENNLKEFKVKAEETLQVFLHSDTDGTQ